VLLSDRVCLLTGRPGTIGHELVIAEPRPRPADFNLSVSFLDYKKQILSIINDSGRAE